MYDKINNCIFDEFCSNYKIICLSETQVSNYDFLNSKLQDYKVLHDEKVYATHGLCVLVSPDVQAHVTQIKGCKSSQILWLEIDEKVLGFKFILGCIYLPCESSCHFDAGIFESIIDDITSFNHPICLIGDCNSRTGQCTDLPDNDLIDQLFDLQDVTDNVFLHLNRNNVPLKRVSQDNHVNNNGRRLLEILKTSGLSIVNGRLDGEIGNLTCYTFNGGQSLIDYTIVSPEMYNICDSLYVHDFDPLLSDTHCAIELQLKDLTHSVPEHPVNANVQPGNDNTLKEDILYGTHINDFKFTWNNEKGKVYEDSLRNVDLSYVKDQCNDCNVNPSQENVDRLFDTINKIMIEKATDCGICKLKNMTEPITKKSKNCKPWFDNECRRVRDDYYRVKNKLKFTNMDERMKKIRFASKRYKDILNTKRSNYFNELHKKLRNLKSNNSKDYWNFLNNSCRKKRTMSPIELEVFKEHFQKISTSNVETDVEFDTNLCDVTITEELNIEFSATEIKLLIKKLKNGKACGIDHIRNEMLKSCSDGMLDIFVSLFNIVLNTGIVPEAWCIGFILPLYKNKGSAADPDNYRGITLLSCVGKLFTALLNERMTKYLDAIGGIGDEQAGFRQDHSTIDHIFALHAIINMYLQDGKRIYCAFIDYKKAFDFVDRVSLWNKLLSMGVNGKLLLLIHNLYKHAKSCIKMDGKISEYFNCNVGVRQGENLSPLLFAIFLNDFEFSISRKYGGLSHLANEIKTNLSDEDVEYFLKIYALLYADDTVVLAESEVELQRALNAVYEYCNNWNLTVNTDKTKIVIFSRGKVTSYPAFVFGHSNIEVVDDYVYLGVKFHYNGSFQATIDKQISQAKKAYYALLNKIRRLQLPVDISIQLFDQLVLPVLLYGCEVWGYSNLKQLEVFHRKFIKEILNIDLSAPSCIVYGDSGTLPVINHVKQRMMSYFVRLCNGKQSKLSYIMYRVTRKRYENEPDFYSPWIDMLENSWNDLGMRDIWTNEGMGFSNDYLKKSC